MTPEKYEELTLRLKKQRTKDRRKLDEEQRLALDLYFGSLKNKVHPIGKIINYYIYSGGDTNYKKRYPNYTSVPKNINFPKVVKNLDYSIEKSSIHYKGKLYRGVVDDIGFLDYAIEDTIKFKSYLSVSFLPFQAISYLGQSPCCLLILKGYQGNLGYSPLEDEILLPRDTIWKVTKIYTQKLGKNHRFFKHPRWGNYSEHLGAGKTIKILELIYDKK